MFTSSNRTFRPVQALAVSAGAALVMTAAFTGMASAEQPARAEQDPSAQMAEACPDGQLCVWDEANGHGNRIDFYECKPEDVTQYGLERVGSYVNNQYDGTVSTFQGPDSSDPQGPWVDQYTSTAFEISDNDRGHLTFGVQVC